MYNKYNWLLLIMVIGVLSFFIIGGCDGGGGCPVPNLDIVLCDPVPGRFTTDIDNKFFPVVPGSMSTLEDDILLEITVPDDIEVVAGIETRVLVEDEFEGDSHIESTRNFFAQVQEGQEGAGTVYYFGEDADICPDGLEPDGDGFLCNGKEPDHEGSWRAGVNGNSPGIFMPADPQVGDIFQQEVAPGIAEDLAEVIELGEPIDVPAGMFNDTLELKECNPLEGGATDTKVFVGTPHIGTAIDGDAELVEFFIP